MRGFFVTFEGGEGAGKSTLLKSLHDRFVSEGLKVCMTREPGGTLFGEELRNFLLHHPHLKVCAKAELFLFLASRAQHVEECIQPALNQGSLVLCDRFSDSTVAYQGVGRELGTEMAREVCLIATSGLVPDLTFFIDIDPAIGLERTKGRAVLDRIEDEKIHFHQKVRAAFLDIARLEPERMVVLDGLLPREQLFHEALECIMARKARKKV